MHLHTLCLYQRAAAEVNLIHHYGPSIFYILYTHRVFLFRVPKGKMTRISYTLLYLPTIKITKIRKKFRIL